MDFPEQIDDGDIELFGKECELAGMIVEFREKDGMHALKIGVMNPAPKCIYECIAYYHKVEDKWCIDRRIVPFFVAVGDLDGISH